MPKVTPGQSDFSTGEIDERVQGRVDYDRYKSALALCENMVPLLEGPVERRPGTIYSATAKSSTDASILVPFVVKEGVAFILEFGDLYMRVYGQDGAQVQSGGSPYEVVTPYSKDHLFDLCFAHYGNYSLITHTAYNPRQLYLTGTVGTAFTLTPLVFSDGPYQAFVASSGTVSSTAAGTVTLTADSSIFAITDDDNPTRRIRLTSGTSVASATVLTYLSGTSASIILQNNLPGTVVGIILGLWSNTTLWPAKCFIYQGRYVFANSPDTTNNSNNESRFDFSENLNIEISGQGISMAVSEVGATPSISDTHGFNIFPEDSSAIQWMSRDETGLVFGSSEAEKRITSEGAVLTPFDSSVKDITDYGSKGINPVKTGKSILYVGKNGKSLYEILFYLESGGSNTSDVSALAHHLTKNKLKQIGFKKRDLPIIVGIDESGFMSGVTYRREPQSLLAAWHRYTLGGSFAGGDAVVESAATLPDVNKKSDWIWLIVKRTINGSQVKTIEYMPSEFIDSDEQEDAYFLDCGVKYDSPKTITAATAASPVVITSTSHGFSNGDKIKITEVKGMIELNGSSFLTAGTTANTFQLTDLDGTAINGSAFTTYVSGGKARKCVSTVSGLTHLNGETVSIVGDGAVQNDRVVSGGSVTVAPSCARVHVGYHAPAKIKLLRSNAGSPTGPSLGKTRRINRLGMFLHKSAAFKIGTDFDEMIQLVFRKSSDPMSRPVPLFSGIRSEEFTADYDFDNQVCIMQDEPLPLRILMLMPQMELEDRQ